MSIKDLRLLAAAFSALLVLLPQAQAVATVLGIDGSRFTVNGRPTFLTGVSYYGGLGASDRSLKRDLDSMQQHGFRWLRLWVVWNYKGDDMSAVDQSGGPREPFEKKLTRLVAECDRRGIVVDVTLFRGKALGGGIPDKTAHRKAVRTIISALMRNRNWYLDLANEHDIRDARFVSTQEIRELRDLVKRLAPNLLVTASFGGHDLSEADLRDALNDAGLDFVAPHRRREPGSPEETERQTKECLAIMQKIGHIAPIQYQEPIRRGYGSWQPRAEDFTTDMRGAILGGAAGWCFHNGDTRQAGDKRPGRSFDLRNEALFDQLDTEERRFVEQELPRLQLDLGGTAPTSVGARKARQTVTIHSSKRYYQDAVGRPLFLVGYYGWAAVSDGYYIDSPARYATMMREGKKFGINYIRVSLGVNRMTTQTRPPSYHGVTPLPFLYVNSKADLDQWDPVFWSGLREQCALAKRCNFIVHLSLFDGVELRTQGGAAFGYNNSFWNPACQLRRFYADPDTNGNGQIDDHGEFYRLQDFQGDTGIGHYQRRLIDKALKETTCFNNVIYELGNELMGSDNAWTTAVIHYIQSRTSKPVTQESNSVFEPAVGAQGWSQHEADTPAQVKQNVSRIVGNGFPAWEDPDGPALSDYKVSPDDLRRSVWYAFVGGAAGWGGFTTDFWDSGSGFNKTKATYYQHLLKFIRDTKAPFWEMTPQHALVSNSQANSCIAQSERAYVVYVLADASVTLDLRTVSGVFVSKTYDPRTGVSGPDTTVNGGAILSFAKPDRAEDWVLYVERRAALHFDSAAGLCHILLGSTQLESDGAKPAKAGFVTPDKGFKVSTALEP